MTKTILRAVKVGQQGLCHNRQDRLHKDRKEVSRVMQKLKNKQNDVRGNMVKTRVVVETVMTSLAASKQTKGLNSRSTYAHYNSPVKRDCYVTLPSQLVADLAKQTSLSCSL